MCQIFSRSVRGLRSSDTPKLPFPIDLLRRPFNSVRTAVQRCEMAMVVVDDSNLQADLQPKSGGLVWGRRPLGAVLQFIKSTE